MYIDQLSPQLLARNEGTRAGTLHVIAGGMKANKTAISLSLFQRLQYTSIRTQLFKPECDYRPELHERFHYPKNYIVSRTGQGLPAIEIDDKGDLGDLLKVLNPAANIYLFAEFHLYNEQEKLKKIILELKNYQHKAVVVDGLDRDFRGEAYQHMVDLMGCATAVDKVYGFCILPDCNNLGELSQRLINGQPAPYNSPVKVVGDEDYQPRCFLHHEVPGKPEPLNIINVEDTLPEQ